MIDDINMPTLAIAGGFLLLLVLACILWRSRRRYVDRSSPESRRTSFHLAVIDPAIAEHGRAAWERSPSQDQLVYEVTDDHLVEVVDIPLPPPPPPAVDDDHTSIGYAPVPPPSRPYVQLFGQPPQAPPRLARGSTPAIAHPISHAAQAHAQLPSHPHDWDVRAAPSVTARMRAARRG
ncbi:MAG: hypothetical protein H0V17_03105 [Deltaproteobacteria bacterium]|nr:hypothetical protein [Deltaproteobacteria bacterium]